MNALHFEPKMEENCFEQNAESALISVLDK